MNKSIFCILFISVFCIQFMYPGQGEFNLFNDTDEIVYIPGAATASYCTDKIWNIGSYVWSKTPNVPFISDGWYKRKMGVSVEVVTEKLNKDIVTPLLVKVEEFEKRFDDKAETAKKVFENYGEKSDEKFRDYLLLGTGAFMACTASYFTLRFIWNRLDNYLNRPHLDFTKTSFNSSDNTPRAGFRDMVFAPDLKHRLNSLLMSTELMTRKKTKEKEDDDQLFRNILFYGPHGLGKYMFAHELAAFAGMDFYEIKSSSLTKFKNNEAAVAFEDFFDEVSKGSRSAIIYIDNASVLFSKYMADNPSDVGRMIRNFVEHTERRSNRFMLILGVTERPSSDNDMISVIDDVIEFKRPELAERVKLLELYRGKLFLTAKDVKPSFAQIALEFLNDKKIHELAVELDKFTVADIVSFMKALKSEAKLPYEGAISEAIINRVLERTVTKYTHSLIT
ncbi:ATP-binding protein [Candidatus Dependentiae bacterium]|nr:ATP-binding protein [Candidatus Dependentiae bacterium]